MARGREQGCPASPQQGPTAPHVGWRSGAPPLHCGSCKSSNIPTNSGGATQVGFAPSPLGCLRCACPHFGAASPGVCLHHKGRKPPSWEVPYEKVMKTLSRGSKDLRP